MRGAPCTLGLAALLLTGCETIQSPCPTQGDGQVVLPLGDSLTRGKDDEPSYRYHLLALRPDLHTLGTRSGGGGGQPDDGVHFDSARYDYGACPHEGHGGFTWADLADGFESWATGYSREPEIILLLAGTNDAFFDTPTDQSLAGATRLVEHLDRLYPNATLLVGLPPPSSDPLVDTKRNELSAALPQSLAALDLSIMLDFVDMAQGFDADRMLQNDGLHPNAAGDAHIAGRWHAAWPD